MKRMIFAIYNLVLALSLKGRSGDTVSYMLWVILKTY